MMRQALVMLALLTMGVMVAAPPDEEEYGARLYFLEDNFVRGNYRDYFQQAFSGGLVRNLEGRTGTCARIVFAESRPFRVTPGKRYCLSFEVFNLGAKDMSGYNPAGVIGTLPSRFLFMDDSWKVVRVFAGHKGEISGAVMHKLPPAAWESHVFELVAPAEARMFTFSIHSAYKNHWGPYLLANVQFKEVKED